MLITWMAATAQAGAVLGVLGGAGAPLDRPTASDTSGFEGGIFGGYRVGLGPVHLQPEVLGRMNLGAPAGAIALGGSATFGALVSAGGYAHAGVGVVGGARPSLDAGFVAELAPPVLPVVVGVRAGWERVSPKPYDCADCLQPADHWLVLAGTVAFEL